MLDTIRRGCFGENSQPTAVTMFIFVFGEKLKIAQCQRTHMCLAKASSVQAGIAATPQRGRGEITASPLGGRERESGGEEVQTDCDKN